MLVLDMIEILPPWENINMIPGEYPCWSATLTILCACGAAYETSPVATPAIWIVVVPAGVTVPLGLHNPPCSWTSMVGPSLPGFAISTCVDSLLCCKIVQEA
jgi:hypothetical protein